ncbi:MAG TPA: hypothetical protein VGJ19_10880 [Streptosporangiaceae bacterium]
MLLTNHVLSGALIGAVVRRPVPAFVLGVASHFALDTVPHWGPFRGRRELLRVAVPDGLTALAAMTALAAASPPPRRRAVTAAMLGAALPDADKPVQLLFGRSPWPAAVGEFHGRIQDEDPGRFPFEAATAVFFALAAVAVIPRGDDPPYPPLRSAPRGGADRITSHSSGLKARFAGLVRSPVRNSGQGRADPLF